ncbi:MAG: pantoate--beta-alanine ligase [Acidimicrobiales bacterium]|nr:pantoate--beta-alanine ligase [Hyphomonadaceae bacterium]RZV44953.1 MAG: pantoate--beta-alanine ligase [Acidimicrobiales bacterium]
MSAAPIIVRTEKALRAQISKWRLADHKIGYVPTMGALHDGHLSLITFARKHTERVVASIYVNPTQFAEGEDLATYPRQEKSDIRKLGGAGCDLVYIPKSGSMYDRDHSTQINVGGAALGLETDYRPHFFGGVALIVTKLFNRVQPDIAVFGKKDYQQFLTIRRMTTDFDIPVRVYGAPIIREKDGLAMSSRNLYFDADARLVAGQLNKIMRVCAKEIKNGSHIGTATAKAKRALLKSGFQSVDYVAAADRRNLSLLRGPIKDRKARLLIAATCAGVRLIDNCDI